MRYRFWLWAHDVSGAVWHWIYYHKIAPRELSEFYQHNVTSVTVNGELMQYDGEKFGQPEGWKK